MSDYISQTITVSSCQSDISNQCRIKTPCITGMAQRGEGGFSSWRRAALSLGQCATHSLNHTHTHTHTHPTTDPPTHSFPTSLIAALLCTPSLTDASIHPFPRSRTHSHTDEPTRSPHHSPTPLPTPQPPHHTTTAPARSQTLSLCHMVRTRTCPPRRQTPALSNRPARVPFASIVCSSSKNRSSQASGNFRNSRYPRAAVAVRVIVGVGVAGAGVGVNVGVGVRVGPGLAEDKRRRRCDRAVGRSVGLCKPKASAGASWRRKGSDRRRFRC